MNAAALETIGAIVDHGGDVDDVLRRVVAALVEAGGCAWAGILFAEDGELVLGPHAGEPTETERSTRVPVVWQGERVAELAVDDAPEKDRMFLERVALLVSGHCLVGWDTGGEIWEP